VVVPYLPLGADHLGRIVRLHLDRVVARMRERHDIALTYDDAVVADIARRCTLGDTGVRQLISFIEQRSSRNWPGSGSPRWLKTLPHCDCHPSRRWRHNRFHLRRRVPDSALPGRLFQLPSRPDAERQILQSQRIYPCLVRTVPRNLSHVIAPRVCRSNMTSSCTARKNVSSCPSMGVMADLSGKPMEPLPPVADRKFLPFDIDNFDDRMKAMKPRVAMSVANTLSGEGQLMVDMTFESMEIFLPPPQRRSMH
jgi:hypothetical protein